MAEPKSSEEFFKQWWIDWREEDFSWEGLQRRSTYNRTYESLADYWRRDPDKPEHLRSDAKLREHGELVEDPDKNPWHLAHVPLEWKDGTATWKSDENHPDHHENWEILEGVVARRLEAAAATIDEDNPEAIQPALLTGAVLQSLPTKNPDTPLCVSAQRSFWLMLDASDRTFQGEASFFGAGFQGDANFWKAGFQGNALFSQASFQGDADFHRAGFQGEASFWEVGFQGRASFDMAGFQSDASFLEAGFQGNAFFSRAGFQGRADFFRASFDESANFEGSCFTGPFRFTNAVFQSFVKFDSLKLERKEDHEMEFRGSNLTLEAKLLEADHWRNAFYGATFREQLSWLDCPLYAPSAFHGAKFKEGIHYTEPEDATCEKDAFDKVALKFAREAKAEPEEGEAADKKNARDKEARELALTALEGGARVLKRQMAEQRNFQREQQLYRFELIARQHRNTIPWYDKRLTYPLFAATSDYGLSLVRPLRWLLGLAVVMGLIFYVTYLAMMDDGILFNSPEMCESVKIALPDACYLSFSNIFKPFWLLGLRLLSVPDGEHPVMETLVYNNSGWGLFFVRLLSTVQSLFSIILLFLFGLALRRKFQIG